MTDDGPTMAIQLSLPGFIAPGHRRTRRVPRSRRSRQPSQSPAGDPLVQAYLARLAARGVSTKGRDAYRYQLEVIARLAGGSEPQPDAMQDLFRAPERLGQVLVNDAALSDGRQLSKWTLAQRRSAIRSFATLMGPELRMLTGLDANAVLDQALRSVAIRIGGGYQLTGGAPRRRGNEVPPHDDIVSVLAALGESPGYVGLRDATFFSILLATGARVNALRTVDGAECVEMPSGRIRLFVHDKAGCEPRELELSHELSARVRSYIAAFNAHAAARRWTTRVAIGQPGALWRGSPRGRWSYRSVRETLDRACRSSGIPPFAPHAFRRAMATEAASVVPRHVVAQAGGWRGLERLDNHYIRPRVQHVEDKLDRSHGVLHPTCTKEGSYATTAPVQVDSGSDSSSKP
jgi:integrase